MLVWQYNNLVTLMDNWDTFEQNLSIAQNSTGTLEEQSKIYEESWVAASNRVKASLEDIYNSVLDSDAFKNLLDGIATSINLLDTFVDSIGGLPGVLSLIGVIGTSVFREQLGNGIEKATQGIYNLTGATKQDYEELRKQALEISTNLLELNKEETDRTAYGKAWRETQQQELENQQKYFVVAEKVNEVRKQELDIAMQTTEAYSNLYLEASKAQDLLLQDVDTKKYSMNLDDGDQKRLEEILSGTPGSITKDINDYRERASKLINNQFDTKNIEEFRKEINKLAADVGNYDKNLEASLSKMYDRLGKNANIEKAQKELQNLFSEKNFNVSGIFKKISGEVDDFFSSIAYKLDDVDIEKAKSLTSAVRELGKATEQVNNAQTLQKNQDTYLKDLLQLYDEDKIVRAADGIVSIGNAFLNTAMSVMSLQSAMQTLNSTDASFGEKLLSVMIALGTTIPAVVETIHALKIAKDADILATGKQTIADLASAAAKTLAAKASKANKEEIDAETLSKKLDTVATETNTAAQGALTLSESFKLIGTSIRSLLPALGQIAAGIAIFSALAFTISKLKELTELATRDWDEFNLDQANTAVTNLTQSYNDLNTELNNFNTAVQNYEEARDGLDSLTKGTEEYATQLEKANDAAMQLIQNYPDITGDNWEMIDGEIIISPDSIDALDQAMEIDVRDAQTAVLLATQTQNEANTQNDISNAAEDFAESHDTIGDFAFGNYRGTMEAFEKTVRLYAENPKILDSEEALSEALGGTTGSNQELIKELIDSKNTIQTLSNSVRDDIKSRENIYQQNANAQLESMGLGDAGLEDAAGRIYSRIASDTEEQFLKSIDKNYMNIMEEYFDLTQSELDSIRYNSDDGILTYKDSEGNTQELNKQQIAAQAAAIKANEEFESSILSLNTEIQNLSNSTDIADQSLANFLKSGNLENLTRADYNALSNQIDYDRETGDYNQNKVDAILGLAGTKEENEARAAQYGYDSAKAMREAFVEGLDVDWKLPEGIKDEISNFLSLGDTQKIRDSYELLGNEAGNSYIEGLNSIYDSIDWSQMTPDEATHIWNQILNFDWNEGNAEDLQNMLTSIGAEIDYSSEAWQNFTQASASAFTYVAPNIEELYEDFSKIHEIIDDIDLGSILSNEDYQLLVSYNDELSKYFVTLADGSHQMIGDPLDLQQDIRRTEMEEYEKSIQSLQGSIEDVAQDNDILDYLNIVNSSTRDLGQTVDQTANSWKQLASQQLNLLQAGGYDSAQISDWRSRLGSNDLDEDDLISMSKAVQETQKSMESSLGTLDEYSVELQNAMNSLAMMSDAEEASEYLKSGTINYAAYAASATSRINEDRWENVDVEEVQEYSDYLQEAAKSSDLLSDSLAENEEVAEEVALATVRMNNGMEELIDNWESWSDVLRNSSKESQEYVDALIELRSSLSDIFGLQEEFISDDFIINNLDTIEQAAMGNMAAIDQMRAALSNDIVMNVIADFQDEQARQEVLDLQNELMGLHLDLEVGAQIDDGNFLQTANDLVAASQMTMEEANANFNAIGFTPVFETEPMEVSSYVPNYTFSIKRSGGNIWDFIKNGEALNFDYQTIPNGYTNLDYTMNVPVLYNENGDKVSSGGSPRIKALISNGGHSGSIGSGGAKSASNLSNYAPRNSGGAAPYSPDSGGSGSKGSGSDSEEEEPTPAELMDYTQITEIVDRYYEITDSLDDMTDALDDAADAADRLYGKDRIKAMEKQRDLMVQQRDLLQQYRSQITSYLAQDRAALENNEYGIHFTFDADGDITNYTQIMTDLWNQLHAAEQTYNSFATKDEQDAYQESTLDPLNKKIEDLKNLIETYDNTQDLLVDVDNQIRDALNEWQDQNYEILTYKVELQIEINDLEQDRLDYYLNKYEDDFYKMAESMALTGDSFPLLTNNLATYKDEMNQLTQAYNNGEISQDAFIEGMKDVNSGLLDNMNALIDLDREMLEYYENTLDKAEDKLGDFTEQLEHQMSILEHYQNVLGLIGKEQDYQMIGSVLQGQFTVAQDQLAAQERWVQTLRSQMSDIQSDLLKATDEKEKDALNEQLLLVTQRLNEAEESVNSLRESVLELAQAILENDLADYADRLSKNLVSGMGFDDLDSYLDTIDKMNTAQEEYLTTTNKVYETNKLIRQAQEDMAENDSLLAKQRYKEYIDYVEQLQEQGRLSEYELKIAQARYEVLQAQIALEEAQNAKDTMRLVRDSQGNYNYVYTANQDNISQAQQALEDAENNLYNIGLQGAQDYQDKYASILEEAFNAFKDLSEQYKNGEITSEEEFNQKRLDLQNYYYNRLKDIQDLYYIAHNLMVEESYNNEADYLFAGIGNLEDFKDATDQYLQDCNNAFDEWQENTEVATDSIGNGMNDLQGHISDVTDTSSELTDQIQDDLIPALQDELEAVRDMTNLWLSHRDALYETLKAYEELQQGAQNTISNAAGVQPGGVLPNIPEEYQADIGAIMAAYLQQGGSINDDLFQQLWNKRNEKVEWLAANGYSSSYWGSYGEETIKGFQELVSGGGDQDWYNYAANMYTAEQIRKFLEQMGLPTFKTGGYTGSWGSQGRLAIIHEKELILNQDDTDSLVNIIREYGKLTSKNNSMDILNYSFNDIISKFKSIINKINLNDQQSVAAQQVSIEASFPNVSVASEIEDAFNDLLNRAAQYVSLNRGNY